MKRSFDVLNVKCGGCAKKIKDSLEGEFGAIEVSVEDKRVTLEIDEERVALFAKQLEALGYPMVQKSGGIPAWIKSLLHLK